MRAINWIRSRQESAELSYWSSFVFFNPKDRSLNNRIYLVYLLVFFSIWWFIVMIWFSEAGAFLLRTIRPSDPISLAVGLELSVILVWFVVSFFQALRRSPVKFSEEDSFLVCQMPVNSKALVLRWMVMPWLKSLIPFLLLVVVLGFSLANSGPVQNGMADQVLFEYFRVGFRAGLVVIPIHLTLFTVNWIIGIWYMGNRRRKSALLVSLVIFLLIGLFFVFGIAVTFGVELRGFFQVMSTSLSEMVTVGFGAGKLGSRMITAWLAAVISMVVLYFSARKFSPSLAAQETKSEVLIQNLRRYGLSDQAQEQKAGRRLGLNKRSTWLPAWIGSAALIWKDVVQSKRTMTLGYFLSLVSFFGTAIGLVFLPSLGGRIFLVLTWTLQVSTFLTARFRQDLAHWDILRQLPIKHQKWILADLAFSGGILLLVSLIGSIVGTMISGQPFLNVLVTLPGMIVAVAGVSVLVILRNARIDLLRIGQAPGVSEFGVIAGAICAAIPVIIYSSLPGIPGTIFACLSSLLIGYFALNLAGKAYGSLE